MTKKDLIDVALKVLGLYLLTLALDSLIGLGKSMTYFLNTDSKDASEKLIYLVSNSFGTVLYVFGFWLLTLKTTRLTEKILKDNTDQVFSTNLDKNDLLQILFCVAGLLITFFAVSHLWSGFTMARFYDLADIPTKMQFYMYLLQVGVPTTKGFIGLILIFASGRLVRVINKLTKTKKE